MAKIVLNRELCTFLLQKSYQEVVKDGGLSDFVETAKLDKYSIKTRKFQSLFDKNLWVNASSPSGHIVIKNIFTKVVINYSNHESCIDPGAVESLAMTIQNHINLLGNNLFLYKNNNWKSEPDFGSAVDHLFNQNQAAKSIKKESKNHPNNISVEKKHKKK
jgi:hypothetical protein